MVPPKLTSPAQPIEPSPETVGALSWGLSFSRCPHLQVDKTAENDKNCPILPLAGNRAHLLAG
jgi:hypothetical protein